MRLYKRAEHDGAFLFRWRSYLPLVIVPGALVAMADGEYVEQWLGVALAERFELVCLLISIGGLAIRWVTTGWAADGTSGRNVDGQRADSLNTTGPYSVVRNPLYLGNFLALLGLVMSLFVWWFTMIVALLYWLYIERIIAVEEAYLSDKFGADYERWAERTPAFIPNLRQWRTPPTPFRLRRALRKEIHGMMAVASAFVALELISDVLVEGEGLGAWARVEWPIVVAYCAVSLAFLFLLFLRKKTRLLH